MTKDEIIKQTVLNHHHAVDRSNDTQLIILLKEFPCIECLVQPMCINRIRLEAAKENDPTFETDVNEGQNVDEWMDWAITTLLEDNCILLHQYLHYVVKAANAGFTGRPLSEIIEGYFGERVGMWYYNQSKSNANSRKEAKIKKG